MKSFLLNDIIEADDSIYQMLMLKKIDKIKSVHPFSVTPPKDTDGRWQTYYKDETGKRKCIKAPNEEELWEKLLVLYSSKNIENRSFYDLYTEWLAYKRNLVNSQNTIKRHEQHYRKYFQKSVLNDMKYQAIDSLLLETECNRIVKEFNLTRKEWNNAKCILTGVFKYAIRKHYIEHNPMDDMTIFVKFRQVNRKTGKTQTYNSEELKSLFQYLDMKYTETEDVSFLAVKLNFMLGLRVGELVTLKWTDIENDSLHICREELRDQTTNTLSVADHTKTHQDRFVLLVTKAHEILSKIEPQGEYIFMRNGERITSRQIAYVLEKYAERSGVATKSTHKMRKTFASNLASNGVPLDAIRELLGHNNLQTTLGYIYNPLTEQETATLIEKALS